MSILRPVLPMETYSKFQLVTLRLAGSSSKFPFIAGFRGFCWSVNLVIPVTEIKCLANTATSNN